MNASLNLFAAILFSWGMALSMPAAAAERQAYDAAAFAAAQKAGKSIVIDVTAPWCPTCKAQKPIIEKLTADPAYKDFVVFEVDFDTGREALVAFKASRQSTLIAFKGATETRRSVGDTNAESIAELFKSAL